MRSRHRAIRLLAPVALSVFAGAAFAQPEYQFTLVDSFTPTYNLAECYLWDVGDQGMACGTSTYAIESGGNTSIGYRGFTWTADTEKSVLPEVLQSPRGVNNTGWVVGGRTVYDLPSAMFVTTAIPYPPGGTSTMEAMGVNDLGTVVGYAQTCNCSNSQRTNQIPFVWDQAAGTRGVNVPGAKELLRVNASNVAVGNTRGGGGSGSGFVYDTQSGVYTLFSSLLPPSQFGQVKSQALDLNDAGVVTGDFIDPDDFHHRGYTWSETEGFTVFAGFGGSTFLEVYPHGINNSGTVVGYATISPSSTVEFHGFAWDAQHGTRDLNDLAQGMPAGFIIDRALKINDQGWIVGDGHFGPTWSTSRAFVLKPIVANVCYANCDASTVAPVLNINDFVCFQNRFAAGDSYANCDQNTTPPVLNVNDFVCFQNQFAAGCR